MADGVEERVRTNEMNLAVQAVKIDALEKSLASLNGNITKLVILVAGLLLTNIINFMLKGGTVIDAIPGP